MSSNNSSFDVSCPDRDWYAQAGLQAHSIVYYIISPFYLILGLFGHALCLRSFYTQSKKETAYMYQIFTTISGTLVMISMAVYICSFEWGADPRQRGPSWYRSCYSCMQFSAIFGTSLINAFITMSHLFTISMSADRLYALWEPTKYRLTNAKRNQIWTVFICVSLGISTSLFQCFIFSVVKMDNDENIYQLVLNPSNLLIQTLSSIRNVIQAVGLILLYFCNVGLLWFYRIRVVAAGKNLNMTYVEKKRQEAERTLTLLTVCQCIWTTVSMTSLILLYILIFFFPSFYTCSGPFYMPLRDSFMYVIDLLDLVSLMLISKQFRHMLLRQFPCWKGANVVQPIVLQPVQQNMVRHDK